MSTKVTNRIVMLVVLVVMAICVPIGGFAAPEIPDTIEKPCQFTANEYETFIWFRPDLVWPEAAYDYVRENFIRDWNGDGIIDVDELNENVKVSWISDLVLETGTMTQFATENEFYSGLEPGELTAHLGELPPSADGQTVTLTFENKKNGKRFSAKYTLVYNELVADISVLCDAALGIEVDHRDEHHVYAPKGATAKIIDLTVYKGAEEVIIKRTWEVFDLESQQMQQLPETGNTCEFVIQDGDTLSCYTEVYDTNGRRIAANYQSVGLHAVATSPVKFDIETSHAVANNVITVVEGDTITIDTNATCADPAVEDIEFIWSWDNNKDGIHDLDEVMSDYDYEEKYSFVATMGHDGKELSCSGWPANSSYYFENDSFAYTFKVVPKAVAQYKMEYVSGIPASAVTPELIRIGLDSADEIRTEVITNVYAKALEKWQDVPAENVAAYEVKLMYSKDGSNWEEVTADNWPAGMTRLTVRLPYPAGTSAANEFVVAHMFATDVNGKTPGTFEYPTVRKYSNYIEFDVTGLSPISVAWSDPVPVASVPKTGDSSTPMLWMLCMLIAATGCVMMVRKRRQNG